MIVRSEFLEGAKLVADSTLYEGVEIWWGYKSIKMVEEELHDWLRDTDLWAYSTAIDQMIWKRRTGVRHRLNIYSC